MDILSIIGIALALAAIVGGQWLEGGSPLSLLQFAAFVIVIGGTLGAVLLQTPLATFARGMRLARWIFRPPQPDNEAAIELIARWAELARREGLLALEKQVDVVTDSFTRGGLQMLVDGFASEKIGEALEIEIAYFEERLKSAARVWEAAGGYAPTVGILGAVLGLIHVMENLSNPNALGGGIAVAFVATIYGVGSANLLFLPIAGKLKALIDAQVLHRELVLDGLLGISRGEYPKLIQARLRGFLERPKESP
jgi:chemotaxis protein MotA